MVGPVSEITPLRTEEHLAEAGERVGSLVGVENNHVTTVALDFGRITRSADPVLYLLGTPGQQRFWFNEHRTGRRPTAQGTAGQPP